MSLFRVATPSVPTRLGHRALSTQSPLPRRTLRGRLWQSRWVRYPVYGTSALLFSVATVMGTLLLYDAQSYRQHKAHDMRHLELSASERGGPDNLPILQRQEHDGVSRKPRLVVVGGGWAAVALLRKLDPEAYDVTVVSPLNYFLFTPLLPSVAVGTVGLRSVTESLRHLLARSKSMYIQGAALNVHTELDGASRKASGDAAGLLEVEVISPEWDGSPEMAHEKRRDHTVYVPYDKLVVAVGSVSSTYGAKGIEHTHRLKTVHDAVGLRKHLLENLEMASRPTTTPEERRRLMSFVVCGGGPTGVEIAAEIYDMLKEDVPKYYPPSLANEASVHLIQNGSHILNTYSEKISEYAEARFKKQHLDLLTYASVKEVTPTSVVFEVRNPLTNTTEMRSIESGCTVWSAGVAMADFTRLLSQKLPMQGHPHALKVDAHLRVQGTEPGSMYAIGDASTIDLDMHGFVERHFALYDKDGDGALEAHECQRLVDVLASKFPIPPKELHHVQHFFSKHEPHRVISLSELQHMLDDVSKTLVSHPPTAQMASQEGAYLAKKLNNWAKLDQKHALPRSHGEVEFDAEEAAARPFTYHPLGSIAYLGHAAAFDLPLPGPFSTLFGGLTAMYAWRSVYLSELVSLRCRVLVLGDYIKRSIWGRDVSWL